jgi:putative two-component system response regulator
LHDVGKIGIPDRILLKKGKLTRAEYALMQKHPIIGDELCQTVRAFDAVRPIVRHHHERLDGRGYPDGLAGDAIPMLARIVSVVDVYDALTSDRPYRKAMTTDAAFRIMRDGGWCERALVDTFIDLQQASDGPAADSRAKPWIAERACAPAEG